MTVFIWLGIMILFMIIEAFTVGLMTIWFAAGAFVAMIACALGMGTFGQFAVFFVVSIVLLYFTRPIALKYMNPNKIRTNYEDTVDKTVKITETVDNINGTGTAVLNGQEWSARAREEGMILPEGNLAKVVAVEGVKLILVPIEASTETKDA
ncbi:MAG: NfeD family protein [Lachnospiraceae bacterium]|nr:NfeD family protein [Lachnospiraceae bacterium]